MVSGAAWGFMASSSLQVDGWSVGAVGFKMIGFLEHRRGNQGNDQRNAEQTFAPFSAYQRYFFRFRPVVTKTRTLFEVSNVPKSRTASI